MLSAEAKTALLRAARAALHQAFGMTPPTFETLPETEARRAAFVSLHSRSRDEPRGCIGTFSFEEPLLVTVQQMARAAAFEDSRFAPLTADELQDVQIEISALTPPTPITAENIVVGRHGLIVIRGFQRGVLLPQVPVEWGWDRDTFLAHTCEKARLPVDAWRDARTQILAFEAEVFSEPAEESQAFFSSS